MKELFSRDKIRKFFLILHRLDRTTQKQYDNKYCQQQVFVRRTLGFLKNRYFKILVEVDTGLFTVDKWRSESIKQKQFKYIAIGTPYYVLGYNQEVKISYLDASQPAKFNNEMKFDGCSDIIAEEISKEQFNEISKLFEYVD